MPSVCYENSVVSQYLRAKVTEPFKICFLCPKGPLNIDLIAYRSWLSDSFDVFFYDIIKQLKHQKLFKLKMCRVRL